MYITHLKNQLSQLVSWEKWILQNDFANWKQPNITYKLSVPNCINLHQITRQIRVWTGPIPALGNNSKSKTNQIFLHIYSISPKTWGLVLRLLLHAKPMRTNLHYIRFQMKLTSCQPPLISLIKVGKYSIDSHQPLLNQPLPITCYI